MGTSCSSLDEYKRSFRHLSRQHRQRLARHLPPTLLNHPPNIRLRQTSNYATCTAAISCLITIILNQHLTQATLQVLQALAARLPGPLLHPLSSSPPPPRPPARPLPPSHKILESPTLHSKIEAASSTIDIITPTITCPNHLTLSPRP
jgi:hypothetical protein